MLTRDLRKIELKLDDLTQLETNKNRAQNSTAKTDNKEGELTDTHKATKEMVEARIGYNPKPRRTN